MIYKRYMTGDAVMQIKRRLVALGYLHAATKNVFGNDTYSAVKAFQTANGLEADGVVGELTWAALFGETETTTPETPVASGSETNEQLTAILNFLETEVENGSIYVWGGNGQSNITESWIRSRESRNQGGANADRAVATWRKRIAAGFTKIRAWDCSGLVSGALISIGLMDGRRDCDGLWARCTQINSPENGALLFRVNSSNSEDETHVGFYFNGYQYHAKGRDVGVVKEKYSAKYWAKIGWFKTLTR